MGVVVVLAEQPATPLDPFYPSALLILYSYSTYTLLILYFYSTYTLLILYLYSTYTLLIALLTHGSGVACDAPLLPY